MNRFLFLCLIALATLCLSSAFHKTSSLRRFKTSYNMALTEISSTGGLDEAVTAAGDKLLVIDYSTTWCGPCKVALPKFVELSNKYTNVVFLKCIGDTSSEASQLMKREGVRSVPSFHFWKKGAKIEVVNGARIDEVEASIIANTVAQVYSNKLRIMCTEHSYVGQRSFWLRKKHGRGTKWYKDGSCYEGDWVNGRRQGHGLLTFPDGSYYSGEFSDDTFHGSGEYNYVCGSVYRGEFSLHKRQGFGLLYDQTGKLGYRGYFYANTFHGLGTRWYSNGAIYHGGWQFGLRHGSGTYKFADGSLYDGLFESGKFHGKGKCTFIEGFVYDGEWKSNKPHGQGIVLAPDGSKLYSGELGKGELLLKDGETMHPATAAALRSSSISGLLEGLVIVRHHNDKTENEQSVAMTPTA